MSPSQCRCAAPHHCTAPAGAATPIISNFSGRRASRCGDSSRLSEQRRRTSPRHRGDAVRRASQAGAAPADMETQAVFPHSSAAPRKATAPRRNLILHDRTTHRQARRRHSSSLRSAPCQPTRRLNSFLFRSAPRKPAWRLEPSALRRAPRQPAWRLKPSYVRSATAATQFVARFKRAPRQPPRRLKPSAMRGDTAPFHHVVPPLRASRHGIMIHLSLRRELRSTTAET